MALSLVEAAKLTNDVLLRGVIETTITDSDVLQWLPFTDVVGTAVTYNRENAAATVDWQQVGGTWTESTPTFTQVSTTLKILGGDADVDKFLQQSYANPNDLAAEVIALKAKALAYEFNSAFIAGNDSTDPLQFDGLMNLVTAGQTIEADANGTALTTNLLDRLIDTVKPGQPDVLIMSKRSRRQVRALAYASGSPLEVSMGEFGRRFDTYAGIPILADDNVSNAQTVGSESAATTIYAVKFGPQGVMGFQNGGIQIEDVGALETKDAARYRVKWYVGLGLMGTLGLAALTAIDASVAA